MLSMKGLIDKHPEHDVAFWGGYGFWNQVSFSPAIDAIPPVVQLTRANLLPLSQVEIQDPKLACMQRGAKNQHTPIRRYADRPPPSHRPLRSRIRRYADLFPDPPPGPEYADTPMCRSNTPIRRYADPPPNPPGPEYADTPMRRSLPQKR